MSHTIEMASHREIIVDVCRHLNGAWDHYQFAAGFDTIEVSPKPNFVLLTRSIREIMIFIRGYKHCLEDQKRASDGPKLPTGRDEGL